MVLPHSDRPRPSGNIGTVEGPLAALFGLDPGGSRVRRTCAQGPDIHPCRLSNAHGRRRAQALTPSFGIFVILWLAAGLWGLFTIWSSIAGGSELRPASVAATLGVVVVVAFGALLVLPAPHASSTILFPSSAAGDVSLGFGGGVTGDSGSQYQPAQAGTTSGATRMGGFLGFSNKLDTALRGSLSNQVIMRVRATVPSFWTAQTFDRWNGTAWSVTSPDNHIIDGGSPFIVPVPDGDALVGTSDIQTFYLAATGPNLVFHAADAHQVWFPSQGIVVSGDGTIRTSLGMGPGTVYTVQSLVDQPTEAQLEQTATSDQSLDLADIQRYTQLPYAYPRVQQLARKVTAGKATVYNKVEALIAWIGAHTRYSTDIPPLPAGADAVNEFLFGNRVGFCEQISTALTVMLRTLGIPAREADGYVPGSYDPITDLYDIQAKDAHAWVQVWFPYYGWQSFDPTAVVPLANPSPSHVLLHDVAVILERAPWVPVGIPLAALFGIGFGVHGLQASSGHLGREGCPQIGTSGRSRSGTSNAGRDAYRARSKAGHEARGSVRNIDIGCEGCRRGGLRGPRATRSCSCSAGRNTQDNANQSLQERRHAGVRRRRRIRRRQIRSRRTSCQSDRSPRA